MKRVAVILSFALVATEALAQPRLQTPRLSCAQARQVVASRGAVVLGTGGFTYDRFVAHRGFCEFNEFTEPAYAPAADTPQCFIGYRCRTDPVEYFSFND